MGLDEDASLGSVVLATASVDGDGDGVVKDDSGADDLAGKSFDDEALGVRTGLGSDVEAAEGALATDSGGGNVGGTTGALGATLTVGAEVLSRGSTVNWIAACAGRVRR